ncbi:Abi family protein [Pseudomonas oryzihabitans]|uniref:Abi family protein n=1 Tax=Pseudomonas oryzihabitans TaxID=47885 RepID=UPI002895EF09|nr:Abi family protein [Pseudomonas oryzihabitans]MDT3723011.1 Abi family protein [Pseudomonas oryzihabitans]
MVAKKPFAKAASTPQALLDKLKRHGLQVPSDPIALQYLNYIGHYRLKGYWYQLIDPNTGNFVAGTTLDIILNRYECDREIRALILEAVERLEVAVRTIICNYLSLKYSPHWYLERNIFTPTKSFGLGDMLSKIEREVGRSKDKVFISSFYAKYDSPYLPPSWAMSECVTLGMWSRTFAILRDPADKKSISSKFGIQKPEVFESWLHTLSVLRNMAAHHDRFVHTKLGVSPANYKDKNIKFSDNKSVYAALTMMHVLLSSIGFNGSFKNRLIDLENRYGSALFQVMGFPANWKASNGW